MIKVLLDNREVSFKMKLIKISLLFLILIKGSLAYIGPGEISPQSQMEFAKEFKATDKRRGSGRIAGGVAAKTGEVNEFCYISINFFNKQQNCGAFILDEGNIATAASCVYEYVRNN